MPTDINQELFTIYLKLADNHLRKPITVDYIANIKISQEKSKNDNGFSALNISKKSEEQNIEELPP